MVKLVMLTLLCLLGLGSPVTAHAGSAAAVSEVPFVFEQGHIIIPIKIKKEFPVEVILATGYEHSIMDPALLQKYKLPAYYTGVGMITGHNDQTVSYSTVPDIQLGDLKITSLNMMFRSLSEVSKTVNREIFGILGVDFFKGRTVRFDFAKRVVRFLPESPGSEAKDKESVSNPRAPIALPMRPNSGYLILPVVESVLINGKKIRTLIDTGAVTTISLSPSAAKDLGLTALPEKSAPQMDKIASLRFADFEMTAVPVILFAKGSGFYRDLKEFEAIAGTVLLQNFVVTFDFRKHVVIMEHL